MVQTMNFLHREKRADLDGLPQPRRLLHLQNQARHGEAVYPVHERLAALDDAAREVPDALRPESDRLPVDHRRDEGVRVARLLRLLLHGPMMRAIYEERAARTDELALEIEDRRPA